MREKTFGMKLQTEQRQLAMADRHNFSRSIWRFAPGGDFQFLGQRVGLDKQAVVTRRLKRIVQPREQWPAVVVDPIRFAVHEACGADDFRTVRLADRLVPQADAKQWELARQPPGTLDRDPGFVGRAGARGDDYAVGLSVQNFIDGDFVVAIHADVQRRVDLAQPLHEVVGERVIVVDDLDHSWGYRGSAFSY